MSSKLFYSPRLTRPEPDDLNWINYRYGGYNYCVPGGDTPYATGSVLPDCTGYAWGRWLELLGAGHVSLSRGNAGTWYGFTGDPYERSHTPSLGAVICWAGGSDGRGHVAVVERLNYINGIYYLTIGQSMYNHYDADGSGFTTQSVNSASNYYFGSQYTFQGFIVIPLPDIGGDDISVLFSDNKKKVKVIL